MIARRLVRPIELELAVDGGEQSADVGTHGLVANEHHHCDRREDQRIFSHRLTALILADFHENLSDLVHFWSSLPSTWSIRGGGWVGSATPGFHPSCLELAVHVGQQSPDVRTHGLVADEHHYRDCGEDQRVLSHCLTAMILAHRYEQFRDLFHSRVLLVLFWAVIGRCPLDSASRALSSVEIQR